MPFKIIFPSGYIIQSFINDNLDVNVVLEDGQVFFGTLFTIINVQRLMLKDQTVYFWATDMVIVENL